MNMKLTRRHLLKTTIASGLAVSPWISQVAAALDNPERLKRFPHGVASGDPTHTSSVIWTRVSSAANSPVLVDWELATDQRFSDVIRQGQIKTDAERDFSVKVDVEGLKPGQVYYYRFKADGLYSEPGRTRTLPQGKLDSLTIALASCSNYAFGYFNAYEVISADKDIEFVLHLGDYLYEYGVEGWGGEESKKLGREHQPAHEIVSLADYRERHAQYKSDPASRLMHAAHPLICIWDDHESANNPFLHGAQNHQHDEGEWFKRRNASVQAYFEWMPVRDPKDGQRQDELWRAFEFGDLATMITLETRHTGREEQVNYEEYLPNIKTPEQRQQFMDEVMGNPQRDMLSSKMKAFYQESLAQSVQKKQPWRLLGNQIPMARIHLPKVNDIAAQQEDKTMGGYLHVGELDLPWYSDTWDGYGGAREHFYQMSREQGASDLLVLTGDSHSFWANELFDGNGHHMGLELGTSGISSPGDFMSYGQTIAAEMDKRMAAHNREVRWTDGLHNGFVKLTMTPEKAVADYVTVNTVTSTDYKVSLLKRVEIEKQGQHLKYRSGV